MTLESSVTENRGKTKTIRGHWNVSIHTALKVNGEILNEPEDITNSVSDQFECPRRFTNYDS